MIDNRENQFYKGVNVSERTRQNYQRAVRSSFLREILYEQCGTYNLFDIADIIKLWDVYSLVNLHPKNVNNHRNYSAAMMKYIRFLNNGQKYGKRKDYGKEKPRITKS